MKVLIVTRYMGLLGGAENVIKELAVGLIRRGVETRVIALNVSREIAESCKGVDFITPHKELPYKFRSTDIASALGIFREIYLLRKLVRQHTGEFDVINAHNFPADWIAGALGKPVVWMCNEVPDFYNNPRLPPGIRCIRRIGIGADRFMVNRCVDTICVADSYNAGRVFERYRRPARIIPYGIEYDFFARGNEDNSVRDAYKLDDSFVVVQVGMISPQKDQMKTIMAAGELKKEIPRLKLILAGRPQEPYNSMLKEHIARHGLQDDVILTGHLSKERVRDLYYAADVAVFPVKTQGGWLAPFEALSCGKPVVTSTTMGAAALLSGEDMGIVSDDLAGSLRTIHRDYPVYREKARRASLWIKSRLNWDNFTDKMVEIFKQTLKRK